MNMLMTGLYNCLFAVSCFLKLGQGQDFIFIGSAKRDMFDFLIEGALPFPWASYQVPQSGR